MMPLFCCQLVKILFCKFIACDVMLIVHCSALVSAFEKAKKKYVVKVKKMETQMQLMTERHESQVSVVTILLYCWRRLIKDLVES